MPPSLFKNRKQINNYQMLDNLPSESQVQALAAMQQNETPEDVRTRPPSIFKSQNDTLKNTENTDEYGLQRPQEYKQGLFSKILQLALPALTGVVGGVGVLPGLLSGFNNMQGREGNDYREDVSDYNKARALAFQQNREDKRFGLDQTKADRGHQVDLQKLALDSQRAALEAKKIDNDIKKTKILPANEAEQLGEGQNIPQILSDLGETFNKNPNIGGPLSGRIQAINPYDTSAQEVQSQINAAKQMVGKFLEGGVLRKEDEAKYEKILPTLKDTPEVRQQKLNIVNDLVSQRYNAVVDSLENSGWDVSKQKRLGTKASKKTKSGATHRFNPATGQVEEIQ